MTRLAQFEIFYQHDHAHRSFDCDCACAHAPLKPFPAALLHTTVLQCYSHQQQVALSDTYSVVFVPSISRVAVVNNATLTLLQRFCSPLALDKLDSDEYAAVQQLYHLGFLYEPESS
jgi:hypothetical protein